MNGDDESSSGRVGPIVLGVLLAIVAAVVILLVVVDDDSDDGSGTAQAAPNPPDFLFTQTAESGTLEPVAGEAGAYTLTLSGVSKSTTYFADRPDREAGTFPTGEFSSETGLFSNPEDLPNAAIVLEQPKNASGDVIIVELSKPAYKAEADELSYRAAVIDDVSDQLQPWADRKDLKLPERFGAFALFIDGAEVLYKATFTVVDKAGNPIPGTSVTITEQSTGISVSQTTDDNGKIDSLLILYSSSQTNPHLETDFPGTLCEQTDLDFTENLPKGTAIVAYWIARTPGKTPVVGATMTFDGVPGRASGPVGRVTSSPGGTQLVPFPPLSELSENPLPVTVTLPGVICSSS